MKVWRIEGVSTARAAMELEEAASTLAEGGLVAFPTETVYGLGANACDEAAVKGIFAAKNRPADNPLIVHISDKSQLDMVVKNPRAIPKPALRLMDAFWPGPLTIVLPVSRDMAPSVHPGTDTVGVRMPNHPLALALIRMAECPVAAPSANLSGRPSPTSAEAVISDLDGKIDGVIDGGPCDVGLESTVVAVTETEGIVYRPGYITPEELAVAAGVPFRLDAHLEGAHVAPKSPGMKYRHYAPDAEVRVWWGAEARVAQEMTEYVRANPQASIAVVAPARYPLDFTGVPHKPLQWHPDSGEPYVETLSRELYRLLRWADEADASHLLIVGLRPEGRALALMNRLGKASEGRIYSV